MERFDMGMRGGEKKQKAKLRVSDVKAAFPHPPLHSGMNNCRVISLWLKLGKDKHEQSRAQTRHSKLLSTHAHTRTACATHKCKLTPQRSKMTHSLPRLAPIANWLPQL